MDTLIRKILVFLDDRPGFIFLVALLGIVIIGLLGLWGAVLAALWNKYMPMLGLPEITWWQALIGWAIIKFIVKLLK